MWFKIIQARLLAGPPPLPLALTTGLGLVAAPTLLRLAADGVVTGTAFATYYPFVLGAGVLLGWRAAMLVGVASALLANFLFMEPRYVLFGGLGDTVGTAFFLFSCSIMLALVDTLRRTLIDVEAGRLREAGLNAELTHLNSELQHRVKNTLTVVQGLATHTFRQAPENDEIVRVFRSRLQALSEANAVLTSGNWELCRLPDLAVRALAPFNGHGAMHINGPACTLPEQACVPLVLALHELGTNAVKYGALSSLSGSVELVWEVRPSGEAHASHQLVLDWVETGGPPVQPPSRRGLGSRLLARQRGIEAVTLDFRPDGLAGQIIVADAVVA